MRHARVENVSKGDCGRICSLACCFLVRLIPSPYTNTSCRQLSKGHWQHAFTDGEALVDPVPDPLACPLGSALDSALSEAGKVRRAIISARIVATTRRCRRRLRCALHPASG